MVVSSNFETRPKSQSRELRSYDTHGLETDYNTVRTKCT